MVCRKIVRNDKKLSNQRGGGGASETHLGESQVHPITTKKIILPVGLLGSYFTKVFTYNMEQNPGVCAQSVHAKVFKMTKMFENFGPNSYYHYREVHIQPTSKKRIL